MERRCALHDKYNFCVFVAFFFPWPRIPRMDTNFTTHTLRIIDRSESREINGGRRLSKGTSRQLAGLFTDYPLPTTNCFLPIVPKAFSHREFIKFNHNVRTHPGYAPTLNFETAATLGGLQKVDTKCW
jgi:hypothetical protein